MSERSQASEAVIERRSPPIGRTWIFRALALLLGLTPLLLAEAVLRSGEWGLPSEADDPFVGFSEVRPLFVLDPEGKRYVTDPARRAYFRPDSFAAEKPVDEYRIFCLGGSTVQGRPYAIETSFTTWLELSLTAADPDRTWEVVNCGGISYASYRLAPILRETLEYQPDLLILYTGHNEFLEDRTYRHVKEVSAPVARLHGWFSKSRLYNVCRSWWLELFAASPASEAAEGVPVLPSEVDAILDYYDGLADYHRDEQWRFGATVHYGHNVRRMIADAGAAGVPIVVVNPIVNLRDCPPFKSENDAELSAKHLAEFTSLWQQAGLDEDLERRERLLEQALEIDPRYAAAYFALAKGYDATGRFEEAYSDYVRAKEEDICPLRMVEPQYELLATIARETDTPLVDARAALTAKSRDGILGNDWMLDHVHPSVNGHQEIADLLLQQLVALRVLEPRKGWQQQRRTLYSAHLDSLGAAYYAHGQERLEGLIRWTQGRAEGRGRRPEK